MNPGLLYTIVPLDVVFAGEDEEEWNERILEMGALRVCVKPDGMGGGTVTRLLSTDPRHYLDPRWQPGSAVKPADL